MRFFGIYNKLSTENEGKQNFDVLGELYSLRIFLAFYSTEIFFPLHQPHTPYVPLLICIQCDISNIYPSCYLSFHFRFLFFSTFTQKWVYVKIYKIIAFGLVGITRVIPVGSHDRHILSGNEKKRKDESLGTII